MVEPMHYLIDGYSVIHARPELRKTLKVRLSHARETLVRLLQTFQDQSGVRVTVVFDGRGNASRQSGAARQSLEVIYSKQDQSADMVIERIVANASKRQDIIVVTADHAIENTVSALGASSISPDSFFEIVKETQNEFSDWLDEHQWKTKRKFSRG